MLLTIVSISTCAWVVSEASVVVTDSGPVRGQLYHDYGVSYCAYQGIPYAENPTGPLRFKPPVPKRPWSDILDATKPGPVCPQPEGQITRDQMSEDCLRINIFVPANTTKPLPVFVNVHGGTYKANSGNINIMFGPHLLLQRDIIFVSMNYRLGALGYLSLETDEAPGNAGLKDLLLALNWIKRNIHHFGGHEITIGGQSSGAAMVHHMLLTKKTTGLFDRAILFSGSTLNSRFLSRYPRTHALALAKELGLSDGRDDIIVQNLREANVFDIIDAQENLYKDTRNIMRPFAPFVPCIEKTSDHAILTQEPRDIIKAGIPQNVPILAGINSREGIFMWPTLHLRSSTFLKEQFPLAIPADIEYPADSDIYNSLVNSIKELYFGDIDLSNFTLTNFYDLLSDTQYTYSVGSWIKIHKNRKSSNRLYYYLFNFDGDLNWSKINYNISFAGVAHADEIGYSYTNKATKENLENLDERSQQTLDNMLTFISQFIRSGNPNAAGSVGTEWPEHGGDGRHLIINEHPTREPHAPFAARFDFWANVYQQYREYVRNGGVIETRTPPQ